MITIDGPAGAGKSTVSAEVARRLGLTVLDTGATYRACALATLMDGGDPENGTDAIIALHKHEIGIVTDRHGGMRVTIDGDDVTDNLHTVELDKAVTPVCQIREIRTAMVALQREFARATDCVCEGRDMGTVVFPDAETKIWLTASAEERAKRRTGQYPEQDYETVLADILRRDEADTTRDISPMTKAEDAVTVDTTGMPLDEVVLRILSLVDGIGA